jgi:probable selenium-dependent hydroxylase accessory protein YqeC
MPLRFNDREGMRMSGEGIVHRAPNTLADHPIGTVDGMSNSLRDALLLENGGVVSLVGAGGKTSLMFRLARELSRKGEKVLTTTTTRIYAPTAEQSSTCILAGTADEIVERAAPFLDKFCHVTAGGGQISGQGKISGLPPEMINRLRASQVFEWIIVEADGAAGRPLKAPADHEPVIPNCTGWLVGMVGLSALGKPLTDQWVFRPEMFARVTGLREGAAVTEEAIAAALGHAQGILKGAPKGCRCLAFLNQADTAGEKDAGMRIAGLLNQYGESRIHRAIVGQAVGEPPVSAVFDLTGQ